ncbi:hypothetical protein E3T28_00460 [Cryobacterium sinapicolor]|uniref:Uncharacterized protein n=1 Tax=Cryobacterium sinapicolor TaxID=1259236 RepID=A0ABY2JK69_9MICO|nr:hypothetical protein E3O67_13445 [Cryobacterium sp. TMT3-29-2]TFD05694.1 hypothetical protein E3T28_00460 [Cryobacterium sinapicolor]
MSTESERNAVAKVVDRLVERFPHIPRESIERAVLEEHTALEGRPIRDYVPVLVERGATGRLRGHGTTSQAPTAATGATDGAPSAFGPAAQPTDWRS